MNDQRSTVSESELSHYDRLGVSPQVTPDHLRQPSGGAAKPCIPTRQLPANQAAQDFQRLKEAYELLADPARRRAYDQQLQQRQLQNRAQRSAPRAPAPVPDQWQGIGERRPLSGGEWFALLLLGLALLLSLVIGLGVAGSGRPGRCHRMVVRCLLPPSSTPLNQHSLRALEEWLLSLEAERVDGDPCRWRLTVMVVELLLEREDLVVIGSSQRMSSVGVRCPTAFHGRMWTPPYRLVPDGFAGFRADPTRPGWPSNSVRVDRR